MPIFEIKKDKLNLIKEKKISLEKDLQLKGVRSLLFCIMIQFIYAKSKQS